MNRRHFVFRVFIVRFVSWNNTVFCVGIQREIKVTNFWLVEYSNDVIVMLWLANWVGLRAFKRAMVTLLVKKKADNSMTVHTRTTSRRYLIGPRAKEDLFT